MRTAVRRTVADRADVRLALPLAVLVLLSLGAVLAPILTSYSPVEGALREALMPPVFAGGTSAHLLGTDAFGRDIFTRILFGTRVSAAVAVAAVVLGGSVGVAVGVAAGYAGGWVDAVAMRLVDIALALPLILLALILALVLGASLTTVVIALSLLVWPRYARQARAETLVLRDREFVILARLSGAWPADIVIRHILPNIANTIIVLSTLQLAQAILVEASLSFLGAGVPPPEPSWGQMVADGRGLIAAAWWVSVLPGAAILLTALSVNTLGDQLRLRLDPRLRVA